MTNLTYKIELLNQYKTSNELFDELANLVSTLSNDAFHYDLRVGDDYNFGTEHEIEVILELLSDLRMYTRFIHCDDFKSIKEFDLDYIAEYFETAEVL